MTAVPAEAAACDLGAAEVVAGGVGPAAAAAAAAYLLARSSYDAVISAGVGGGVPGVEVGTLALASAVAFADLGAQTPDGFVPVSRLGVGMDHYPAALCQALAARVDAAVGTVLTVATVTGSAQTADQLRTRHPDAVAEGMEGFGVAEAAARAGVPFGEVRAISNAVGPRDRSSWRLDLALSALRAAFDAIGDLS